MDAFKWAYGITPDTRTLCDVMADHAVRRKNKIFCTVAGSRGDRSISFGGLYDGVLRYAAAMRASELAPGERVAVMLPTGVECLFAYFGAMTAGLVPALVAPPFLPRKMDTFVRSRAEMLEGIGAAALIVSTARKKTGLDIKTQAPAMRHVFTAEALEQASCGPGREFRDEISPAQLAMIQFSSGSGGRQKAVALTHANIVANLTAVRSVIGTLPDDVIVCWLPLFHDMGLLGCVCQALFSGCGLALMPPTRFISSPGAWLRLMHEKSGTIGVAPNFGYQLCVDKIKTPNSGQMDLSKWRIAMNGAEMATEETMTAFSEKFAPAGFRARAFMPVYGLAEATVAVCFTPPGAGPTIDRIDRHRLETEGVAEPARNLKESTPVVSVGKSIPGVEVRIMDTAGNEAAERVQGNLYVRSPSLMNQYFSDPEATKAVFHDGWLDTGDLAYRAGADIFVTGRSKDIIVRAGGNYHPEHFEQAVSTVDGIQKNGVAAFGVFSSLKGTEDIVMMVEADVRDKAGKHRLAMDCRRAVSKRLELTLDDLVIVAPMTIPRTTSGKVQRPLCRRMYLETFKKRASGDRDDR
ncbi:MAG: AMP-binding protein [Desulfobacterales bacterium]|nr:AMP-binding protein [Desulfobacterales bacterium]